MANVKIPANLFSWEALCTACVLRLLFIFGVGDISETRGRDIWIEAFAATKFNKIISGRESHKDIKILPPFRDWLCPFFRVLLNPPFRNWLCLTFRVIMNSNQLNPEDGDRISPWKVGSVAPGKRDRVSAWKVGSVAPGRRESQSLKSGFSSTRKKGQSRSLRGGFSSTRKKGQPVPERLENFYISTRLYFQEDFVDCGRQLKIYDSLNPVTFSLIYDKSFQTENYYFTQEQTVSSRKSWVLPLEKFWLINPDDIQWQLESRMERTM
jgi:hypothetical protein